MSGLYQLPVGEDAEPDGCDTWWSDYKESTDMSIPLSDSFQRKQFESAMKVLRDNYKSLKDYDRKLFNDLEAGYEMVGHAMPITRKQMNHIKTVAFDFERGA